jgi:hypothetical protein
MVVVVVDVVVQVLWLSFYVKKELQYPKYSRRTKHERLLP